jgi:hypothetical protein
LSGGDGCAVEELAHPSGEGFVADHDVDQRPGLAAIAGRGHRPAGHLHQGIRPSLGAGAGEVADVDVLAVEVFGFGPVRQEQLAFDAFEGSGDFGAADDVEEPVGDVVAPEGLAQAEAPRREV